ncbi:unnamed protein product [Schistosoma mattheei]|uniref:Uncharacterized protein n=1 Tax=Schistosoma mattheei TaxID=31246 RepID=A0A3P8G1Z4_9TREM|nr:unnamed protein product [Schistosoma mattheei]
MPFILKRQYFWTVGAVSPINSTSLRSLGSSSGQQVVTRLSSETTCGGCTNFARLVLENSRLSMFNNTCRRGEEKWSTSSWSVICISTC